MYNLHKTVKLFEPYPGAMDWGFGGIEIKREVANPATRIPAIIFPVDVPEI